MHRLLHGRGGQPAGHGAAALAAREEASVGQHVEVLHDRRQRDREWPRQLADRQARLLAEMREDRAPRRIGEGSEGAVERGILILNHVVKFRSATQCCQGRKACCVSGHACAARSRRCRCGTAATAGIPRRGNARAGRSDAGGAAASRQSRGDHCRMAGSSAAAACPVGMRAVALRYPSLSCRG